MTFCVVKVADVLRIGRITVLLGLSTTTQPHGALDAKPPIKQNNDMSHFEQAVGQTDEWYTPRYVFQAMDAIFDLDVAMSTPPSYLVPCRNFIQTNALAEPWRGFVWCNPPFGPRNGIVPWLDRFFAHGNGVCLTPDRTSAPWWQDAAKRSDGVLFVSPKIRFIGKDGAEGTAPSTGTTLMAVGHAGLSALHRAQHARLGLLLTIAY